MVLDVSCSNGLFRRTRLFGAMVKDDGKVQFGVVAPIAVYPMVSSARKLSYLLNTFIDLFLIKTVNLRVGYERSNKSDAGVKCRKVVETTLHLVEARARYASQGTNQGCVHTSPRDNHFTKGFSDFRVVLKV